MGEGNLGLLVCTDIGRLARLSIRYGGRLVPFRIAPQAGLGLLLAGAGLVAHAAHPLITEDTGTQGAGRTQIELTAEHAHDHDHGVQEQAWRYAAVTAYGLQDTLDVLVTVPYVRERVDDGTVGRASGIGDVGVDLKWRFYESGIWSAALKPGLVLPTGDDRHGLGAGRVGYGAYLVTSADLAPWVVHVHVGYLRHRNTLGERDGIRHFSLATTRDIGRWRLVADIGTTTAADRARTRDPAFLIGGIIYALQPDIDLDAGYKRSLTSSEDHGAWLAGIALRF